MEYNLTRHKLARAGCALNTVSEQPVDIDLTLPDYCPDIGRILSCTLIPRLYIANVSADRLNIEGGACVRVLYTDGDRGCLRSYEHTAPFSESLPIGESTADCAVYAELKPEYINCRALSPRKLSLHGAFSLCARIIVCADTEYCSYDNDDDLQTRSESITAAALSGLCGESFSVQEDISVGGEISSLLSHRLSAHISELKAIRGKIMLSAELKLELMYQGDIEKGQTECMSYSIPVSRVIDCDGVDENSVIDGSLDVMSYDLRLGGDALDGSALLSLEAKLCFNALCYSEQEIEVLSDVFSTEREAEARCAPFSCGCDTVCRTYTDICKTNASVDDEVSRIIDVHCEKLNISHTEADGRLIINGKLCVGILYENSDGELRYVERDAETAFKPDTDGRDCVDSLRASVDSLSYRMADSKTIELRTQICYRMILSRRRGCPAVTAVSADDDAPVRESDGALILYYTDGSDSVWDISKRFCSRPADIISENALSGDTVDGGVMLLIPTA